MGAMVPDVLHVGRRPIESNAREICIRDDQDPGKFRASIRRSLRHTVSRNREPGMFTSKAFRSSLNCWVLLFLGAVGFLPARAHDAFEVTTLLRVRERTLEVEVTMARATALAATAPNSGWDNFEPQDFESVRELLERGAGSLYTVSLDGQRLSPLAVRTELTLDDDVDFFITYPHPPGQLLRLDVKPLPHGYGAMLVAYDAAGRTIANQLLTRGQAKFEVSLASSATSAAPPKVAPPSLRRFLVLGVEHILTGYDHLLFLLALLVACRRTRTMLGILTCFTIAHSITLALAALGYVAVSSAWIEPLIAASIVFVGIENLLRHDEPKGRWLLTFCFGLLHGFGFAGALQATGLGTSGQALAIPLIGFNLGVELGQIAVAAIVLPLFWQMRKHPRLARLTEPAVSGAVALAGTWWLLQRSVLN